RNVSCLDDGDGRVTSGMAGRPELAAREVRVSSPPGEQELSRAANDANPSSGKCLRTLRSGEHPGRSSRCAPRGPGPRLDGPVMEATMMPRRFAAVMAMFLAGNFLPGAALAGAQAAIIGHVPR